MCSIGRSSSATGRRGSSSRSRRTAPAP